MATSERVLSTIGAGAAVQDLTEPARSTAIRPLWRQMLLDFITIIVALALVIAIFGERLAHSATQAAPQLAMPMMMITVLCFAGAYPRRRTPLDIGDMEGLLRGICCATVLLILYYIGARTFPSTIAIVSVFAVIVLLMMQRELGHILRTQPMRAAWPAEQEFSPRHLTQTLIIQAGETCELRPAACEQSQAVYLLKRALDLIGAAVLLALSLPLMFCVAVLIKLDSRGPVLIRQRRLGTNGRPFYMWKFRSMYTDARRYAHSPVSGNDPRLTRLGRELRRFSIDELPQLLNVFTGEMSLVGPRPEMPFIVRNYEPYQRLRLCAKPGITGLWQISPARALPIHEHLEFDLFYIDNQTIFLDLAILVRTVSAVFRGIGAA